MSRRPPPEAFGLPRHAGLGMAAALAAAGLRSKSSAARERFDKLGPESAKSLSLLPAGPPGAWTVDLPGWTPPSLNDILRWHPMKRARENEKVDRLVGMACVAARVARAVGRRRLTITLTTPKGRCRLDDDNARKSINDSLVTCGALVDDKSLWLETTPVRFATGPRGTRLEIADVTGSDDGRSEAAP